MNGGTAKLAKWHVRIIDPKVIQHSFIAQGKFVNAQNFECILVSKDAGQYMLAAVPFEFKDPNVAQNAYDQF